MTEKLEVNGSQTVHQLKVGEACAFHSGCNWGAAGAIGAAGWSSRFATARMEAPSLIR
jgi:hypothetical protein